MPRTPRSAGRRHWRFAVATITALSGILALGACSPSDDRHPERLRMMIPNSPGGGYDLTGRAAAKTMQDNAITDRFEINNVLGASGTVAMQRLHNEEGAEDLVMLMGLGVVGAVYTNESEATISRMTPIARLVEEQEGIVVPADSPFKSLDDLIEAWSKKPKSVTIGGGSTAGGPDHLFPMQLADELGISPLDVAYVRYDGGGPLTAALIGDQIDVAVSGLGEFEGQINDGALRVLAVSGERRMRGVDAPTLTESGVDLVFSNWRGVIAPPGISSEEREYLVDIFTQMSRTTDWHNALRLNGWEDSFATGEEFEDFLKEQDSRVATTLEELGLA